MKDLDPPLVDADGDGDKKRAPLYCSGQSFLPDGRVLVTGGNKRWLSNGYSGWEGILTFNPWTETWTVQDDEMARGRWYPSQVLTGDGRTLIMAGDDETGQATVGEIEVFRPDPAIDGTGGVVERLGTTDYPFSYYPFLFTLPSGQILHAGPGGWEPSLIDPDTGRRHWDVAPGTDAPWLNEAQRIGGTAVLRPDGPDGSDVVTTIGGTPHVDDVPNDDTWPATTSTETLDLSPLGGGTPDWTWDAPLNVARSYHNTVILPDGGLLTVGGAQGMGHGWGNRWNYEHGEARPVELLEPGASAWRLGAAQAEDRGYHSIAILLPDGSVLSAGDDVVNTSDTFEIYKPPYLFRGTRPSIASAPSSVAYGQPFDVATSGGATKAVLVAPSAVTHSVDMNQRHVELAVERTVGGTLSGRAPATGNVAPPGYYMLFVLGPDGVPSVARWVKLGGTWTPPPPPPPPEPPKPDRDPDPEPPRQEPIVPPPAPPVPPGPPRQDPPRVTEHDRSIPKASMQRLTAAQLRTLRRTGAVTVSVRLDERARVEGVLRRHTGRRTVLTRVARRWLARGTRTVAFRVPAAKRKALRGGSLRLSVVVSDAAGNTRTLYTTFRLKAAA